MKDFHIITMGVTSIILFVFGLENFSKEIQKIAGEGFRKFLSKATKFSLVGVSIGAVVTAIIQSSSATSVIAISLVNAGVLSFKNSVGIIFGANVGTTITAQLVAFKLTSFGPVFIIMGFILSMIRSKYAVFGRSLFYFGFVFFSLSLISGTLKPLQNDPRIVAFLTQPQSPFLGILIGCLVTAVVQSSSVTTGLAVIFTQQGLISLDNAIPILMGANIGTTITALIAVMNMDISAKKSAMAHFMFNVGGVLLFLPVVLMGWHNHLLFSSTPAIALANFHFAFNVIASATFLLFIGPFVSLIDRIWSRDKTDFERIDMSFFIEHREDPVALERELKISLRKLFFFLRENYSQVTLSIESNYKSIYQIAKKRIEYVDFLRSEFFEFFADVVNKSGNNKESSQMLIKFIRPYDYMFQVHDSVKDLTIIKDCLDKNCVDMGSDLVLVVRGISTDTTLFFNTISKKIDSSKIDDDFIKQSKSLQIKIDQANASILQLTSTSRKRRDVGVVFQLLTYSQRLKDKLKSYHRVLSRLNEANKTIVTAVDDKEETGKLAS